MAETKTTKKETEAPEETPREFTEHFLVWQKGTRTTLGFFPTEEDAEAAIERAKSYSLQADADEFQVVSVEA